MKTKLTIKSHRAYTNKVVDFVEQQLTESGVAPEDISRMLSSVAQIFERVAKYAENADGGSGSADIEIYETDEDVTVVIRDRGDSGLVESGIGFERESFSVSGDGLDFAPKTAAPRYAKTGSVQKITFAKPKAALRVQSGGAKLAKQNKR